jgi:hypothetical protein
LRWKVSSRTTFFSLQKLGACCKPACMLHVSASNEPLDAPKDSKQSHTNQNWPQNPRLARHMDPRNRRASGSGSPVEDPLVLKTAPIDGAHLGFGPRACIRFFVTRIKHDHGRQSNGLKPLGLLLSKLRQRCRLGSPVSHFRAGESKQRAQAVILDPTVRVSCKQ